jgi:hypothetical protein
MLTEKELEAMLMTCEDYYLFGICPKESFESIKK